MMMIAIDNYDLN